jgi:protein involved in polysaccharide export with SLBB domain
MDGRFETRYPAEFEVWMTDLQNLGHSACGRMRDISQSGVCVVGPLKLGPGDIVRIDVADSVLFGLITYSLPEGPEFRVGIEVQRVLLGGSDLSEVLELALNNAMPKLAGLRG